MIASSNMAKAAALGLAVGLHGVLLVGLGGGEAARIEGGPGGSEVRLGRGFADMAAGRLVAEVPERAAEAERVRTRVPERAAAPEAETPRAALRALPPVAAPQAAPQAAPEPAPVQALAVRVALAAQVAPERLEAAPEASGALRESLRPKARARGHEPPREARPARPAPRGKAVADARAGAASGAAPAKAAASGGGTRKAAGNAAASNYPGLVMRRLARAGKPRVNARGVAVVAFTIAGNGGLAGAALAQSSGSEALDLAALRIVRGAAPFPKPPPGAQRSFSIRIKGR